MGDKLGYSVVSPAHNEEGNLEKLVKSLQEVLAKTAGQNSFEIIIVNDNSTDNSEKLLEKLKSDIKQLVVVNRKNAPGVGNAIREGLAKARGDIIITMDADLSHDPREIPQLLKALEGYDMVCGSRYTQKGIGEMNLPRKIISRTFNNIFKMLLGLCVRDFTSGYRVIRRKVIEGIHLKNEKFGLYIEIPLKASKKGFRITEAPIHYYGRNEGESKLSYLKEGPEYIKVILDVMKS